MSQPPDLGTLPLFGRVDVGPRAVEVRVARDRRNTADVMVAFPYKKTGDVGRSAVGMHRDQLLALAALLVEVAHGRVEPTPTAAPPAHGWTEQDAAVAGERQGARSTIHEAARRPGVPPESFTRGPR